MLPSPPAARGKAPRPFSPFPLAGERGKGRTPFSLQDQAGAAVISDANETEGEEWSRFEAARVALSKQFGNSVPAGRYAVARRGNVRMGGVR